MIDLHGIFPPLTTPFDKAEHLRTDKLSLNIQKLSRHGLAGFLVLGSNGELVMLDQKEKLETYYAAREAIEPGKLMLAGTGCESTRETIQLTREAGKAGADAVLVLNPSYFKGQMDLAALVSHYEAVAEASTVPVIIYNMPANSGLDMTADTLLAIAQHPNIIGLKDSGGNLEKMEEVIRGVKPGFQVLAGSAGFLLPALKLGAVGGIAALANIAPVQCLEIYQNFREGKLEEAQVMQEKIIALNLAVTRQWGVPALKEAMDHLGLYGGASRKPLLPLKKERREQLLQLMEEVLEAGR